VDTSGAFEEKEKAKAKKIVPKLKAAKALPKEITAKQGEPEIGQLIIFPCEIARGHRSPFGIGAILEIGEGGKIKYQWWGNDNYNAKGIFVNAWKNLDEDLAYYRKGRVSRKDVPWTNEHTEHEVFEKDLIARGDEAFLFTSKGRLNDKMRKIISEHCGTEDTWPVDPGM
jgi:hypothetical protein